MGITSEDITNTKICYEYSDPRLEKGTVAIPGVSTYNAILYGSYGWLPTDYTPNKYKKIHLNTCMKIKSGTGDKGTPFVIKSEC